MNFKKKVERGVTPILIADTDLAKTKELSAYMASTGTYECDGPIRRSDVTGAWFQWWKRIDAARWSATREGLKPLSRRT